METGIAPSVLWEQAPQDLATVVAVLEARAEQMKRRR